MSDEKYYEVVADEMAANKIDKALLIKATVLADGDEKKAKIEYIKLRVQKLKSETRKEAAINTAATSIGVGAGILSVIPYKKITIFLLNSYAIIFSILLVLSSLEKGFSNVPNGKYIAIISIIAAWILANYLSKYSNAKRTIEPSLPHSETIDADSPKKFYIWQSKQNPPLEQNSFFGGIYYPWRRYYARMIDYLTGGILTYLLLYWVCTDLLQINEEILDKTLFNEAFGVVFMSMAWIPIEALFLSKFEATPGKKLFGISVTTINGNNLTYLNALKRSLLVLIKGLGFNIPLINIIMPLLANQHIMKTGSTGWDKPTGSIVVHSDWGFGRYFICTLSIIASFWFIINIDKIIIYLDL